MLAVRHLSKSYGAITVLEDISFVVNSNDRAGIVGSNGVGKTTLLTILIGRESIDSGSFSFDPLTEVGYLPQTTPEFSGHTMQDLILESVGNLRQLEERMRMLEAAMSIAKDDQVGVLMDEYEQAATKFQDRGGYELDYRIDTILDGLRISYLPRDREVQTLSGVRRRELDWQPYSCARLICSCWMNQQITWILPAWIGLSPILLITRVQFCWYHMIDSFLIELSTRSLRLMSIRIT